jgi:hypothetical protein
MERVTEAEAEAEVDGRLVRQQENGRSYLPRMAVVWKVK